MQQRPGAAVAQGRLAKGGAADEVAPRGGASRNDFPDIEAPENGVCRLTPSRQTAFP